MDWELKNLGVRKLTVTRTAASNQKRLIAALLLTAASPALSSNHIIANGGDLNSSMQHTQGTSLRAFDIVKSCEGAEFCLKMD
ncbi:MAG: hypothetical protein ACI9RO_002218 [Alteromonas macleodii]